MPATAEPTTDLDAYFAAAAEAEIIRADADGQVTLWARVNHADNFHYAVCGYASYGITDAVDLDNPAHIDWFNAFSAASSIRYGDGRLVFHTARSPFIRKVSDKVWEALRA